MVPFIFVDTKELLSEAVKQWGKAKELAIDLECENNLHYYGAYIALIQISNGENNWVIDVLKLKEIDPLIKILEDKEIMKIFHDISFDFRILADEFDCRPKNIFDTQIAALLLGKEDLGLGSLLEKYMQIKKERKYQMADWTKRPLTKEMLSYAVKDTLYLIKLKNILKKELEHKKRLSWAKEEFKFIEKIKFTYKEQDFLDVKGVKELNPKQLGIFKQLFSLRKKIAKLVDRPVHFVINNKRLKEFAIETPHWKKVRSVHPIIRQSADMFKEAVQKGKEEPVVLVRKEKKRYTDKERGVFETLYDLQKKIAEKIKIRGHLIINKEQMGKIAFENDLDCLRGWQKDLLKEGGFKV